MIGENAIILVLLTIYLSRVKHLFPPGGIFDYQIDKNRDAEAEAKAVAWMTEVVGNPPPEGSYEDSLKNGAYLCQ